MNSVMPLLWRNMDHVGAPASEESSQQRRPGVMARLKLSVSVSNRSSVVSMERQWSVNGTSVVFQAIIMLFTISITVSTQTGLFTHSHAESIPETPPFTGRSLMGLCLLSGDVDLHAIMSWCLAYPHTPAFPASLTSTSFN